MKTSQIVIGAWAALSLCTLAECAQLHEEDHYSCSAGQGRASKYVNGYTISVAPYGQQQQYWDECSATIADAAGKKAFRVHDHEMAIAPVTGSDLDGDGNPEVVLEGYSGGAHCCWTYWIVSLGKTVQVRARLYNQRGIGFTEDKAEGKFTLVTQDGRFDYFDDLSHASSPMSNVYLRFVNGKLGDVSSEFWSEYESEIREVRKQISQQDVTDFKSQYQANPALFEHLKCSILQIVLAYLSAGKPKIAWETLKEMWPPQDLPRIKALVLKTRGNGFVSWTVDPAHFPD